MARSARHNLRSLTKHIARWKLIEIVGKSLML